MSQKKMSSKQERSKRKLSISRGLQPPLSKGKHASVIQNIFKTSFFDDVQSVRRVSEDKIGMNRGGKCIGRKKRGYDNDKAIEDVQEMYANRDESDYIDDESEIVYGEVEIDALANFNEYYPRFNPIELNFKERMNRRHTISRSFYFN